MKVFKDKSYNWYLSIKYDNTIKELWASLFIPKNTPYCHHNFKPNKKYGYGVSVKPCKYWCYKYNKEYDCEMEYCKYLKSFLDIQDQIKDCGINEYHYLGE